MVTTGISRATALAALKISGRVAYEHIRRPKARTRGDVPCSPDAITTEWLTAVLCDAAPGAEVTQVEVTPVSSGTHARHRLVITYNEAGRQAGLPASAFTKSLPTVVNRMMGGYNGTARVEGRFLTELRPTVDIEAPVAYHAAFDRDTLASCLVMEDLVATKQASFCNHRTYVSPDMAEDMVDLMATLHARYYADPQLDSYRWIAPFPRWFTIGAEKMAMEYYTRKAFDTAAHLIPADILSRRDEVWPAAMRALGVHDIEPQGLLHSDVHVANWYRTGEGRMGLCDWQGLCRGHWSRDFAYAISTALTTEDRRKLERDLLARYLDRFASLTGTEPDFERSFLYYRQQVVHALVMWTITLCHSPLLPAMQPEEITLALIERTTTAMSDLDSLDC